MADAVTTQYIYPPNYEVGFVPGDGSERGREGSQRRGSKRYILHLTNISDGTGESTVIKYKLSDHICMDGRVPRRTVIDWIDYDVFGMDVTLYWDRSYEDNIIARIPGGATTSQGKISGPFVDPGTGDGTDGTGNIVLTTANAASGDSYDLRICIRPKPDVKPRRVALEAEAKYHMNAQNKIVIGSADPLPGT